jgi:hypothetical protein
MKNIAFILLAVLFLSACEEQLNVTPKSSLLVGNFFGTPEDFDLGLTGIYDVLGAHAGPGVDQQGTYFRGLMIMGRIGTDEMRGEPAATQQYVQEMSSYTFNAFSPIPVGVWTMRYEGISRCNLLINQINITDVELSEATRDRILGETYFLRGFFYFQLVKYYGGVPIIAEDANLNEFKNIRSTVAQTYERVIADFKKAEELLPVETTNGRASKYAAKSYLAKAYLQMAGEPLKSLEPDIAADAAVQAAAYAKDVIDNGGYELEENYTDNFSLENEHGKEYIFSVEHITSDNEGGQVGTWDGTWSFDVTKCYAINRALPELFESYNTNDLRRDYNVINYMITDGEGTQKPVTYDGLYFAYKWRHDINSETRGYNVEWQSPFNFPLTRFADILLVYAEAQCRADGTPNAEAYDAINSIRTRAGLSGLKELSGEEFLQAVLDERKWELCYEGHRWFDLVRYGKLIEAVQACKEGNPEAANNITENKHELFPIPQREIQISGGDLKQNPGYSGAE